MKFHPKHVLFSLKNILKILKKLTSKAPCGSPKRYLTLIFVILQSLTMQNILDSNTHPSFSSSNPSRTFCKRFVLSVTLFDHSVSLFNSLFSSDFSPEKRSFSFVNLEDLSSAVVCISGNFETNLENCLLISIKISRANRVVLPTFI